MSTERERLVAASMLKQLLSDRVAEQVDPVKFWETELDFRLSPAQFGLIREIAQSLVEAVDRLTVGQSEDAEQVREVGRSVPGRLPNGEAGKAPNACFYFASVNGPTSGIVARRLTDLFGRDAVARELARQQSKGQHPSNGVA